MTRKHSGPAVALAAWAALTSSLVLVSWARLMDQSDGLPGKLLVAIALVAAAGVGLRRLGLEWPFTFCGQVLTAILVLQAQLGSSWLPSAPSLKSAVQAVLHAVDSAREYPAPVAGDVPSIMPLLLVAGVAIHLVVDLVAVSLRRALAASLPLLAAWVLPVSVLGTASGWPHFVLASLAWLALLAADQAAERSRWGRSVSTPWLDAVRPGAPAAAIGTVAVLAAVVLPSVLPHRPSLTLPGSGPGRSTTVALTDPVADLQRNLIRGDDIDLVHVTVPEGSPAPAYVRLSVLDQFDGRSWRVGSRSWPQQNTAIGLLPDVPALSLPGRRIPWGVQVSSSFASDWLPTPRWTVSLDAGANWRFDRENLDVHRAGTPGTAAGESYTALEHLPEISPETLVRNGTADPATGGRFTALPEERPAWVREIATSITRDATTDYARAVALQEFFQRNFTYSTATAPGNGFAALGDFLNRSRSGYCEQFAASMALLARELGMPARVSVGFLRAEQRGTSSYEFSAHDLHAWPEIWFRGVGWVGFEPTPTSHTRSVPSWSRAPREPAPTTSTSPSAAPSVSPRPDQRRPEQSATGDEDGIDWRMPTALGGVVLAGLAACLPRLLRRAQRSRRLDSADVEDWWTELRASVVDLGIAWPAGASPRATARTLLTRMDGEDPVPPSAALDRLVSSLELARYAAEGEGSATSQDVATCVAALRANATPREVRRARWWPRSVAGQGRLRSADSA